MDGNLKSLIKKENLENSIIIEKDDIGYKGGKIIDFKTHWENGRILTHSDGSNYGLAFFNAFTISGWNILIKELEKYPNTNINKIQDLINNHRLREYIHGDTKRYKNTKTGDEGIIYMTNLEDYKNVLFANETSKKRGD